MCGNPQVFGKSKKFRKVEYIFQSTEDGRWTTIKGKQIVGAQ